MHHLQFESALKRKKYRIKFQLWGCVKKHRYFQLLHTVFETSTLMRIKCICFIGYSKTNYCLILNFIIVKKTKSSTVKYILNGNTYIGSIETFVKMCNCECEKCNICDDNICKSYVIISRYEYKRIFECHLVNDLIPFIYLCDINLDAKIAVPVENIEEVLFEISIG